VPRPFQIVVFLSIAISLVFGLHYYLWLRLVRDAALPGTWARLVTAVLTGLAISLPLAMIFSRLVHGWFMRPLAFLAFSWMGIGFLFAVTLFATDLGTWGFQAAAALMARVSGQENLIDPARRLFFARLIGGASVLGVAGLAAWGFREALGSVGVVELDVKIKNLPKELAGFRLVQISDVHIGPLLHKQWLEGIVAKIQTLKPDLVAITGDLVDGSVEDLKEHTQPLADLAKTPRGLFFVTGNHEYYSGADEWIAHLKTLGVQPLRNERKEIAPGLWLAGIDDLTARGGDHGPDLPKALLGRDPSQPVILLAHQPKQFLEAANHAVDLTLSGHTHGGQIWPFTLLVTLQQPYVAGLHKKNESQLYVSRGTGFWGPPLRVGAPPEITLLRLQPA
jgi:predicted MPP superfamily phosphohydrolase